MGGQENPSWDAETRSERGKSARTRPEKENPMIYRVSGAACLVLLAGTAGHAGELEKEFEKLQGDWVAVREQHGGFTIELYDGKGVPPIATTIKGDKRIVTRPVQATHTLMLNPTAELKEIDQKCIEGRNKGTVFLGIYKLEGDTLTICTNSGGKERPQAFTAEKPGIWLYVYKRVKP
jgi:uncharacterized protein (TIGR03067 family)